MAKGKLSASIPRIVIDDITYLDIVAQNEVERRGVNRFLTNVD